MIPKVPICIPNETDVWSHRNQAPTRTQATSCFNDNVHQILFRRYVFKEVARENEIQRSFANLPMLCGVLLNENDVRIQAPLHAGIEIHRKLPAALDVIDELTVTASQIENRCIC